MLTDIDARGNRLSSCKISDHNSKKIANTKECYHNSKKRKEKKIVNTIELLSQLEISKRLMTDFYGICRIFQ